MAFLSIRIKVPSHTTIFCLIFPFDTVSTKILAYEHKSQKSNWNIVLKLVGILFLSDSLMRIVWLRTVKIRNFFKIEWKLRLGEHVAIRLSCSTDAESFKIQTENRIKWPHLTTWLDNSQDCVILYREEN